MKNSLKIFAELIEQQKTKLRSPKTTFLKEENSEVLAQIGAYNLSKALDMGLPVVHTAANIGKSVLPQSRDEEQHFLIGMAILYPLCKENYIDLQRASYQTKQEADRSKLFEAFYNSINKSKKQFGDWSPKMFVVVDTKKAKDFITELSASVDITVALSERAQLHTECPEEWDNFYHRDFGSLVANGNRRLRRFFDSKKCAKVLEAVNKLQSTPLRINEEVLETLIEEKRSLLSVLKDEEGDEAFASKYYELEMIITLAKDLVGKEVYSAIFLDFRGRVYYGAYHLNRCGSDYAKGLLVAAEPIELGADGWDQLTVAAVDYRDKNGESKLPFIDKLDIACDDLDEFIAIGRGCDDSWKAADCPTQFLGVCIDIAKAHDSGDEYSFKSAVFISKDASQSGPMLMGIATQDHKTMKFTNVLKSDRSYDLYKELGAEMLRLIDEAEAETAVGAFRDAEGDTLFDQVVWLHRNKKLLIRDAVLKFQEIFQDPTVLRKWAKYPTMLRGYAAEEWCIAEDLWNKFHKKNQWLTPVACKFLSDKFFQAYENVVPACFQVMEGFKKFAGIVHKQDDDVIMIGSYSGFPTIQSYYKSPVKDVRFKYKGKLIGFAVKLTSSKRDYHATLSGTPANTVHSWDKELLLMITNEFIGPLAVNHDAYFTPAGRVTELNRVLRECTYRLGTEYNLLEDSIIRYNLEPNDLGITVNEVDEEFCPQCNEFCYA